MSVPPPLERPAAQSEQELLQWMRQQPRTLGWDAIVAYDRVHANRILMQDYITRLGDSQALLPPVSQLFDVIPNKVWEYVQDYRIEAPRLSFERVSFENSQCTLGMRVAGGLHLGLEKAIEERYRRVARIDVIDAARGPQVTARVALAEAPATLTTAGKVQLDLSRATQFEVSSPDPALRALTGSYFQELFRALPDPQKLYVLTTLTRHDGRDVFRTGQFTVRVFPAPSLRQAGPSAYGDGAVLLFIAATGSEPGRVPLNEQSWKYPIPMGRSATLMMGHHFVLRRLVAEGITRASPNTRLTFENASNVDAPVGEVKVSASYARGLVGHLDDMEPFEKVRAGIFGLPMGEPSLLGTASFSFQFDDDALRYRWSGAAEGHSSTPLEVTTTSPDGYSSFDSHWSVQRDYRFGVADDGALFLTTSAAATAECSVHVRTQVAAHVPYAATVARAATQLLQSTIDQTFGAFLAPCEEIEIFRSKGLLFHTQDTVNLDSAHFPMDVVLFGDLTPAADAFSIAPLEIALAAEGECDFSLRPSQNDVRWIVERVDAGQADPGSISSAGHYRAPAADAFDGPDLRVRVSALCGTFVSSALVRVLKRAVAINPVVAITALGGARVRLSAGAIDGAALTWSLQSQTGARLQIPARGTEETSRTDEREYLPGPLVDAPARLVSVDEVRVVSGSGTGEHTSYIVVLERGTTAQIRVRESSLPEGHLQLELSTGQGAIEGASWSLLAGGGHLDPVTGVLTLDAGSPHAFVVVMAALQLPGVSITDCIILPVPLIDLESLGREAA